MRTIKRTSALLVCLLVLTLGLSAGAESLNRGVSDQMRAIIKNQPNPMVGFIWIGDAPERRQIQTQAALITREVVAEVVIPPLFVRWDAPAGDVDEYHFGAYRQIATPTAVYWEVMGGGWIGSGTVYDKDGNDRGYVGNAAFESNIPKLYGNVVPSQVDVAPYIQGVSSTETAYLVITVIPKGGNAYVMQVPFSIP